MQVLTLFRGEPAWSSGAGRGIAASEARGLLRRGRQLNILVLQVSRDGRRFKLRNIERINRHMCVVHGLLSSQCEALNGLRTLIDSDRLILPVGENIVGGDPYQVFVPTNGGQMASDALQDYQGGTLRVAAHCQQLRID